MRNSKPELPIAGILQSAQPLKFVASSELSLRQIEVGTLRAKKVHVWRISYRSNGHLVNGFVVLPKKRTESLPCVIWNRGGSGDFGKLTDWQVFAWLGRVASWGYVVIATQYSGNDGSEGLDEMGGSDINDVLVLGEILRRIPHADVSRIGMIGGSRGGMMTYLCLAKVKWIKAAVVCAGLADLERNAKQRPEMRKVFNRMFGGSVRALRQRSAVRWVKKMSDTPLLLLHGTNDWRVGPQDSIDLASALLAAGRHPKLVLFEGDDHSLSGHWDQRWYLTRDWMDRFVKDRQSIALKKGL